MTISKFSKTISLIDFAFAFFCGKCRKMQTFYALLNFLVAGKNLQIWYNSKEKFEKFHD